uniref:Uncharacterized protein n=1 Tax=Anguilla anguilla TaxID=7936 RepID=A0A0E9UFM4_ANGAN
MSSLQIIF